MNDLEFRLVPVRFEGEGRGEAPLTWAQAEHWQVITDTGTAPTIGGAFEMPPGSTVDQVVDLLRFIMSRHQGLRTRLKVSADGRASQVCSAAGTIDLTVIEAGPDDPARIASALQHKWSCTLFDYEQDWPLRMAVVTAAGAVSHVVAVYLHLAIDAGGIAALMADLSARNPLTGAAAGPVTALQPLELAGKQAKPAAQRQSAASIRHFEQVLRAVPVKLFGDPRPGRPNSYQKLRYRSPAIDLAIARVAADRNVSRSAALFSAFLVALSRQLNTSTVWTMVLVNNRFRPGCVASVSHLVQGSPCQIELAGRNLGEAAALAHASLLNTYKTAYYDGRDRRAAEQRIAVERGEPVQLSCCYNDRGDERPAISEPVTDQQLARAELTASWAEEFEHALPPTPLFINIDYAPRAVDIVASFDNRYLDLTEAVGFVSRIEAAAVQTALNPDSPVLLDERIHTAV